MKKLLPVLIVLFALSSCSAGKNAEALAKEVELDYTDPESVSLTARVEADYGERIWSFLLALDGDTVTILEPESVSGVTARIGEDGVTLAYDGAEVFTGELTAGGLSPAQALPLMLRSWGGGLLTSAQLYGDTLELTHRIEDGVSLVTEFDADTLYPSRAELYRDGQRVLSAEFYDVTIGE